MKFAAMRLGRRRHSMALAAALATVVAGFSAAAATASVPNICHITGITKTVGRKVFPKLSSVSNLATQPTTPPNLGAYCELTPKYRAGTYESSVDVELWSASVFSEQVTTFDQGGKNLKLHNLGHGAVYEEAKKDSGNGPNLLFERGAYTVLIDPASISIPARDFPSERQFLTLAHAIYKHLK
jgi:hypothetical protein